MRRSLVTARCTSTPPQTKTTSTGPIASSDTVGENERPLLAAHRRAVEAHDRPRVDLLPAQAIGHAQRLDGAGERDHRVVRQREKAVPTPLGPARAEGLGLVRMGDSLSNCDVAVHG